MQIAIPEVMQIATTYDVGNKVCISENHAPCFPRVPSGKEKKKTRQECKKSSFLPFPSLRIHLRMQGDQVEGETQGGQSCVLVTQL